MLFRLYIIAGSLVRGTLTKTHGLIKTRGIPDFMRTA
jgi:hypothetical protein